MEEIDLAKNRVTNLIIKTKAQQKLNNRNIEGSLILRNNGVEFISTCKQEKTTFKFDADSTVKLVKKWGFMNCGIKFSKHNQTIVILVDYSEDWIRLINKQISQLPANSNT